MIVSQSLISFYLSLSILFIIIFSINNLQALKTEEIVFSFPTACCVCAFGCRHYSKKLKKFEILAKELEKIVEDKVDYEKLFEIFKKEFSEKVARELVEKVRIFVNSDEESRRLMVESIVYDFNKYCFYSDILGGLSVFSALGSLLGYYFSEGGIEGLFVDPVRFSLFFSVIAFFYLVNLKERMCKKFWT
jgi:hypothetical protein